MQARSHFAKLFPPPRFMTLPAVGVDISDSSVKFMLLEPEGDAFRLKKWGDIAVPKGTLEQGVIKDAPALSRILSEIRDTCGTEYMRVSLPEERAYLFQTVVPKGATRHEICDALEFRLEENVPLSPRDAFFDYEHVTLSNGASSNDVAVTVYDKVTVLSYLEACRLGGVVPLAFEIEPEAIARAVIRQGDEGTHLILDFGKIRTGIGIVHRGLLMLTSTVDIGGKELDTALSAVYRDADTAELIRLKNECGLLGTGDEKAVRDALLKPVTALKQEIASRISYWGSRDHPTPIDSIILCGGIANLAGLPEFFTSELGIQTEQALVWKNIFVTADTIPPITKRYSYGYATAAGLALGGFTGT